MSDYLLHYWNLFHDFATAFGTIVHRQMPLPLLANFYKYLPEPLKQRMREPDFYPAGTKAIARREEVGPAFDRLLAPFRREPRKGLPGKVLVHVDYVRLAGRHYQELFARGDTLLVGRGGPPSLFGHPLLNIRDYAPADREAGRRLTGQAKEAAARFRLPDADSADAIVSRFAGDLPHMAETAEAACRLLDAHPAACVIVGTTEDLLGRALVLAAGARGIPSICLQHGLIMGEEAYLPVFATQMAVYGPAERDWYEQRGVDGSRIAVIGHPRYDAFRTNVPQNRAEVLEGHGLDPERPTVLVATQPTGGPAGWLPFIRRLAKRGAVQVLVKPHPLEIGRGFARDYANAFRTLPHTRVIGRHVELGDTLAAVDAVAVQSSTVGLEALLAGKPLFVLRDRRSDRYYDYYDGLAPFVADDPVLLADALLAALAGDGPKAAQIRQTRDAFLRRAYPVALSGPLLMELVRGWTGRLAGSVQSAFAGRLVKGSGGDVYRIDGGVKRHIAGLSVFAAAGYRWEDVCLADDRILARLPSGPPIFQPDAGGLACGHSDHLAGRLHGFLVQGSGHAVYLLERGFKRHIATEHAFARMRFAWENVCRLDDRILCAIPSGPFLA